MKAEGCHSFLYVVQAKRTGTDLPATSVLSQRVLQRVLMLGRRAKNAFTFLKMKKKKRL